MSNQSISAVFVKIASVITLCLTLTNCAVNANVIHLNELSLSRIDINHSECVVLVHGLWRSGLAMSSIASNKCSELSENFGDSGWYQWIVGPAAVSLSTKSAGIIATLKPIDEPVGIIAAYRDWSLWPSSWLPSPNDGTVSVESMRLPEMDDFILINSGHAFM